jgi:putative adenylate-forming enzyme
MLLTFLRHYLGARRRFHGLTEASLHEFQNIRARKMVRFAMAHAPYWREHWKGCDPNDWRTLPTSDKASMMAEFARYNTANIETEVAIEAARLAETNRGYRPIMVGNANLTAGLSSGTSGHRGLFLVSPGERAAWAGVALARALPGSLWQPPTPTSWRVSLFLRAASPLYETVRGRFVRFHFHDLTEPMEQSVAALNTETPEILLGPPSLLARLAAERRAGRLQIQPMRVFSVAEVLEPQDEAMLAEAFGLKRIHQFYQATEGLLAVTCAAGGLHLQEDIVAVQTEPLSDGRCSPILTDLWRTTQPILRYRLGDVLRLTEKPCPCGSVFRTIEAIEGRQTDLCQFGGQPVYPELLRGAVLAQGGIADYRLIQERPNHLAVYLQPARGADPAAVEWAVRESLSRLLPGSDIEIRNGLPPADPVTRKRRRVQRCWE